MFTPAPPRGAGRNCVAPTLPIWAEKRETARRVRQRIAAVMRWAVPQGYREDNPAGDTIGAALSRNGGRPRPSSAGTGWCSGGSAFSTPSPARRDWHGIPAPASRRAFRMGGWCASAPGESPEHHQHQTEGAPASSPGGGLPTGIAAREDREKHGRQTAGWRPCLRVPVWEAARRTVRSSARRPPGSGKRSRGDSVIRAASAESMERPVRSVADGTVPPGSPEAGSRCPSHRSRRVPAAQLPFPPS